jgi:hypothetical protein
MKPNEARTQTELAISRMDGGKLRDDESVDGSFARPTVGGGAAHERAVGDAVDRGLSVRDEPRAAAKRLSGAVPEPAAATNTHAQSLGQS